MIGVYNLCNPGVITLVDFMSSYKTYKLYL